MGFCCKVWSLNDLTPSPISRPGTHCLQWQRANARANLWWRHEPFPGETSISLRALCWKSGFANRSWWYLGIIPSDRCCQFSMISQILEDITFHRALDVVRKPLVFSAHYSACWSQSMPFQYRTWNISEIFARVGWGGMSYWVYVTPSCHNWKRNDFRYSSANFIY